jgi:hypothetical protein
MASTVTVKAKPAKWPKRVDIRVGILEPEASHAPAPGTKQGPITIGELAEKHEFGLGNVPERSFIRAGFDQLQEQIRTIAREQMTSPAGAVLGAERTAVKAAALFRNRLTDGIEPGITNPQTIASKQRRGFKPPYKPLIETGVLKSSIAGDVEVIS